MRNKLSLNRSSIEKFATAIFLVGISYFLADLTIMKLRPYFLPEQLPAPQRRVSHDRAVSDSRQAYEVIKDRNIFHADGVIPEPLSGPQVEEIDDGVPVPTSLPIELIGTIVHVDARKSIATLKVPAENDPLAVRKGNEIPRNLATVTDISRGRVVFRNNQTQRLEYIQLQEESLIQFDIFGRNQTFDAPIQRGEVTQLGDTEFQVERSEVQNVLSDMNLFQEILNQARAEPRTGRDGRTECYNLVYIESGSIFERLGLKAGDCIHSANGHRIDSPARAIELFERLKQAPSVSLGIERGTQQETLEFRITE